MNDRDYPLPDLAQALARRYAGVQIIEATMARKSNGDWYQSVRCAAPLDELKALGLVTDEMIAYAKRNDGRRSRPRPPRGDDFALYDSLDGRSIPGSWDLWLTTEASAEDLGRAAERRAAARFTQTLMAELAQKAKAAK